MWEDIKQPIQDDADWLQENDGWANPRGRQARCDDDRRNLLADAEALLEFAGPDLAGRNFGELLRQAAQALEDRGGGPLSNCLAGKWGLYEGLPAHLREQGEVE